MKLTLIDFSSSSRARRISSRYGMRGENIIGARHRSCRV
jgi:hypothetical protein